MKKKKDFITVRDMTSRDIFKLLKVAAKLKKSPFSKNKVLKDKTIALLFQKPSTRTRISFEVAAVHLGGYVLYLSPSEVAMGTREPVKDVACVISRYVDGVVARVFSHEDVEIMAKYSDVPVINGLSDLYHPCQALSDVFTVKEKMGKTRGVKLAYIGDGNNVLNSLMLACAKTGINVNAATPVGYEPDPEIEEEAKMIGKKTRAKIQVMNDPIEAVKGANVVYTDVWTSMGQEEEKAKRLKDFSGFQLDMKLIRGAKKDVFVMHCLPAHRDEEITTDVIDGKNSIVYDQAENRMHVQKALLVRLFS